MRSVGREATGGTFFYHKNILWLNELLSYHTFLHTVIYALFHLRCMKVSLEKTAIWQQKRNKEMRKKTLQETKNVIKYNIKQHKPSCGENKTFSPRHTIVVPTRLDNENTEISLE